MLLVAFQFHSSRTRNTRKNFHIINIFLDLSSYNPLILKLLIVVPRKVYHLLSKQAHSMEWPLQDPKSGKPVTTPTNQAIWAAAIEAAYAERPDAAAAWKERLLKCNSTQWRNDYMHLIEEFVHIQARCSSETILKMCHAGLDAANKAFVFLPPGNVDLSNCVTIEKAFSIEPNSWEGPPFETTTYTGQQYIADHQETPFQLASPYGTDDKPIWLKGGMGGIMDDENSQSDYTVAAGQLDAWDDYGCMEPSAAEHAKNVMALSNVVPLVQDKTFVLLGLTSEMGPALHLLKIPHAHILGVARGGEKINALVRHLEQYGATTTKLQIPCSNNGKKVVLGADLLKQGPPLSFYRWRTWTERPMFASRSPWIM
jgi:hypothetical protein